MHCAHCHEKIPLGMNICIVENDEDKCFCCRACLAVYQTLNDYQHTLALDAAAGVSDEQISAWLENNQWITRNSDGSSRAQFFIEGMHCSSCAWLIEHYLQRSSAVHSARADYANSYLDIVWQQDALSIGEIINTIASLGYRAWPYQTEIVQERQQQEDAALIERITMSAIFTVQISLLSIASFANFSTNTQIFLLFLSLIFSLPLFYFAATPFFLSAWNSGKAGKIDSNTVIYLAIISFYLGNIYSVIYGYTTYFATAALFCLTALLVRYGEKKSYRSLDNIAQPLMKYLTHAPSISIVRAEKINRYLAFFIMLLALAAGAYWFNSGLVHAWSISLSVLILGALLLLPFAIATALRAACRGFYQRGFFLRDTSGLARLNKVSNIIFDDAAAAESSLSRLQAMGYQLQTFSESTQLRAYATYSSQQKIQHLQQLQLQGHVTLFVADEKSDEAVLAKSDIALCLLNANERIKNKADIFLLHESVDVLPDFFKQAKRYRRIVRQNVSLVFISIFVALPLAAIGLLAPWLAVMLCAISPVVMHFNARRLSCVKIRES